MNDNNKTITFAKPSDQDIEIRRVLGVVYEALKEKGYNPINQLVGYIISEDPISNFFAVQGMQDTMKISSGLIPIFFAKYVLYIAPNIC